MDAHQHFWDLDRNYYPWLRDEPMIPFRYGDYSAIRRNYMPVDYRKDADGYDILGSVYVEAEWDPKDPVAEMRYIDAIAARRAAAEASRSRMRGSTIRTVESILEQQAAFSFVRSIRHKPRANPAAGGSAGGMTDALWRRGYDLLRRFGLRFDLQTPWWHLHEAAQLARAYPDTQIILNHTGLAGGSLAGGHRRLEARDDHARAMPQCGGEDFRHRRAGPRRGPPTPIAPSCSPSIDLFGAGRAMFASNFPVDSLCATFGEIFGGFRAIVADFSASDQRLLFRDNAIRIYAMEGA